MNDYIEEKLALLQAHEEDLDKMPCGDERAEKIRLIDMARREIMQMEERGSCYKAEERITNLMDKL